MREANEFYSNEISLERPQVLNIKNFAIIAPFYLALNGCFVVVAGFLFYGENFDFLVLLAAFLATYSVYSLNKATDKVEDEINQTGLDTKSTKFFTWSAFTATTISLAIGLMISPSVVVVLLTPMLVGLVYSVKLSKNIPRIKEIPGVKSVSVALCWAFTGSILPAVTQPILWEKVFLVFLYIFINILVNTILFDVLDMKGDLKSGVKTIPHLLGHRKTKRFLLSMNSSVFLWITYCVFRGYFLNYIPALLFGVFYVYFLLFYFLKNRQLRSRAGLMIDGEWIPITLLMIIF
ncbi:MAG: UbiA family prenyltransferase [Candidatus Bathyarchaeota archaeon]|nr:UbiA family prenyltransferase [Candidatus Bathyarchaeota archaeon]